MPPKKSKAVQKKSVQTEVFEASAKKNNYTSKIEIYTDGSCLGNPGPGGWATLMLYEDKKFTLSGGEPHTTNNRMEMTAIIKALTWIHQNTDLPEDTIKNAEITIFSDSNLIIQSILQGWKRKANLDLWAEIDLLKAWLPLQWVWVKAHATNKNNNEVDKLAVAESKKMQKSGK